MLSVIVPVFNEADNVAAVTRAVANALGSIPYELLFVDDGSGDDTFARVQAESESDPRVRGVGFSRNFGKEAAIYAGLAECRGDCAVLIDGDLQHPPAAIPEMYALWEQGNCIVEGKKKDRGREGKSHRLFARLFYGVLTRLTGMPMQDTSDFKLLDRRVVDVILSLPERRTFFRGLSFWTGFPSATVYYEVAPRLHGQTKWSGRQLASYAVSNITSFSSAPIKLVFYLGAVMLLLSVVFGAISLAQYFSGRAAEGFTTVILLLLLIGGLILLALGVIGNYVARIFDEVKARPRYILTRRTGGDSAR